MRIAPGACTALVFFYVAAIAADVPPGIALRAYGHGDALTDSDGMTLYTYVRDQDGKSACYKECAAMFPPVVSGAADQPFGDWSILSRDDGLRQWVWRGRPLYRSLRDSDPGMTNADEFNSPWRAAFIPMRAPPGFSAVRTIIGHVLTDPHQMTLYRQSGGPCDRVCERTWTPAIMPAMASPIGAWTAVERADGRRQWAFKSAPLYTYALDVRPGDTRGDNAAEGWRAVVVESPPPVPGWVTVQPSDAGEVYADASGRTLYTLVSGSRNTAPGLDLYVGTRDWQPVVADPAAQRIGDWAPVLRPDNIRQWAYKGLPLFTNAFDTRAGDVLGARSSDTRFAPVTRSGLPMPGIGQ